MGGIARRRLRNAVRGEGANLDEALREADLVESRWPHANGGKVSLEYKAALLRQQESESPKGEKPQHRMSHEKPPMVASQWQAEEAQSTSSGSNLSEEAAEDEDCTF